MVWFIIKAPFMLVMWIFMAIGYAFENKETIKEVASEAVEVGKEVAGVGKEVLVEVAVAKRELLDVIDDEMKEYHREKKDREFEEIIKDLQRNKSDRLMSSDTKSDLDRKIKAVDDMFENM